MFTIKKMIPFMKKVKEKGIKRPGRFTSGTSDKITISLMIAALVALGGLIYYQVRPLNLVDIKVPVSTTKPAYKPGESVAGIFFGEVYYEGRVEIVREIFCTNFRSNIPTNTGLETFVGNSTPLKLEGETRVIGKIPSDAPIGKNCIIRFVNTYEINTPFGTRKESLTYYTQNFLILDPDAEETDVEDGDVPSLFQQSQPSQTQPVQSAPQKQQTETPQQSQNTNTTPNAPAEPVEQPTCTVDLLGIKLLCD